MNKKNILLIGGGVTLVALLAIYFVAVPAMQVSSYKQTATTKHSELNETVNKLGAILESDTFVKSDVEPAKIHSDVKNGNELVKNVETKIGIVKKDLTTFNSLPVLDFNSKYKTAKELRVDEESYVNKTESFLSEMKQVLAYFDKVADVTTQFKNFETTMNGFGDVSSSAELASLLDKSIQGIQPTIDVFAKVTPPASLKASHEYGVKTTNELLSLIKQLAATVRAEDDDKTMEIVNQIAVKSDEMTKKSDSFNIEFIRSSELRKLDDALNQLNREISIKQASL